jgi:hypothetical protein
MRDTYPTINSWILFYLEVHYEFPDQQPTFYEDNISVLNYIGRTMGIEPTNGGTTNHCLNHLATLAIQQSEL